LEQQSQHYAHRIRQVTLRTRTRRRSTLETWDCIVYLATFRPDFKSVTTASLHEPWQRKYHPLFLLCTSHCIRTQHVLQTHRGYFCRICLGLSW
jgi:hypothetical protein